MKSIYDKNPENIKDDDQNNTIILHKFLINKHNLNF